MPHVPASSTPPPYRAAAEIEGLLGEAIALSRKHHLAVFVQDENSSPIALFSESCVCGNHEGDWYGEHAGKWLIATARAVAATVDPELTASLRRVADFLVARQGPDGYLGTYAPERRFMCRRGPAPLTWDGAPTLRTWDVWVHAYLVLGLLEASRALNEPRYTEAARRIGDLCWRTFHDEKIPLTTLGNHHGLSATVLLDPATELYFATADATYLRLAQLILAQIESSPALSLVDQILSGTDAAFLATGKAYQLCWNLVGIAKLARATDDDRLRRAVNLAWENIRDHHLTLGGGPWGGVAHRSREVFNPRPVFSPQGYVETCSTLAWIQLNRELLNQTGEARFAEEIEKSAYNDLLGAQAPAGDNWCYYSFPNGRRVFTTYWRCCKSSGPMALEELPLTAYAHDKASITVLLYGPSSQRIAHASGATLEIRQDTTYPFSGRIQLHLTVSRPVSLKLRLRVPTWTKCFSATCEGTTLSRSESSAGFIELRREWSTTTTVSITMEMVPVVHRRLNQNIQESRAPDGSPVAQEVLRFEYAAVTRGPLVYSSGLIDGFKTEETVRWPERPEFTTLPAEGNDRGPKLELSLGYRAPLQLQPYFEAGGRADHTWRLTWFSVAPD